MNTSFKLKSRLCLQFVKGPYAKHNLDRINYVMKIYRKLIKKINTNEEKVINRLKEHNIWCKTQQPIPILSSGGKLEHLYLSYH